MKGIHMTENGTRKGFMVVFVALAAMLVLASAALACTGYAGRFIVDTPTGSVTSDGDGSGDRHGRCNDEDPTTQGTPAWPADSEGVTVTVAPVRCNPDDPVSKLPSGQYTVSYITGEMVGYSNVGGIVLFLYDCMNPPGPDATRYTSQGGVFLGTVAVDAAGNGQTSDFLAPLPETTPGEGMVCISNLGGGWGNDVPMKFL